MAKDNKIKLKYRYGKLPEGFSDILGKADDVDLRVLLTAALLAKKESGTLDAEGVASALGIDMSEARASLKFWRGAGIVEDASGASDEEEKGEAKIAEKPKTTEAKQKNIAAKTVSKSSAADDYSTSELADIMESRVISPGLIDEAQRIFGKMFRTYDIGILVSIVERLGFSEESVLYMLAYLAGKNRKTMRYAETFAMSLHDEGITDTAAVAERISFLERSGEIMGRVKTMFGIGDRELTSSEKKIFTSWIEKYGYDVDVIKLAYDITVDNTQKPLPKYANSIIEKWFSEGLRTAAEVTKYIERQKNDKAQGSVAKSYDADDFFEAALQRSYEELK